MYAQQKIEEKLILEQRDDPIDFLWLNRIVDALLHYHSQWQRNKDARRKELLISRMNERQLRDIGVDRVADFNGTTRGYRNLPLGRNWIV